MKSIITHLSIIYNECFKSTLIIQPTLGTPNMKVISTEATIDTTVIRLLIVISESAGMASLASFQLGLFLCTNAQIAWLTVGLLVGCN
jgi:hypothetical protein